MQKTLRLFVALGLLLTPALRCFSQPQPSSSSVSMPLAFEVNRGQADPKVKFLARSREGILFFTDHGVTLSVPRTGAVRILFANCAEASVAGQDVLISRSNYLSHDPGKSLSNIENFGAVLYQSVYPGIDVRFYARERHLEHDFQLAPGADPSRISLQLEGADRAQLLADGSVEFSLGKVKLIESKPQAWQTFGGKNVAVEANWKLAEGNQLALSLGNYDHNQPLTIDPVLAYSTHLGGNTGEDLTTGTTFPADTTTSFIALDSARNIYVVGTTTATDFPTTAGAFDRSPNQQSVFHEDTTTRSGFVSKFDKTGTILIFSTFLRTQVDAMALDSAGHVYTAESAFDEFPGPVEGGDPGFFVDKLSLDGSHLLFSNLFANNSASASCAALTSTATFPHAIAVDNSGHVWVTGTTTNPCLPNKAGRFQQILPNQNQSGFAMKIDTTQAPASSVVYSTYLGGNNIDGGLAITADSSGDAYVAGITQSTNFPHSHEFGTDTSIAAFVIKLNSTGTGALFSTLLGGAGFGNSSFGGVGGIAIDAAHNVFVSGSTRSAGFPTTAGAFDRTFGGGACAPGPCADGFVSKLSAGGTNLLYSTFLGGSNEDTIGQIAVNSADQAFVAGTTTSTNFPVTANAFKKTLAAGATNGFVTALQSNGGSLVYSTLLGGSKNTTAGGIFVDPAFNAWVVGNTSDADFPVTANAFQPGLKGESDGFIAKVVIAADLKVALNSNVATVAHDGNVILLGTVANLGPDGSDNIVFTEPMPTGYKFQGINTNATSCTKPVAGATSGTVVCNKTRLESGQNFFVNVFVEAIAASGHNLTSTATAKAKTQDLNSSNNSASVTVHVK